MKVFEPIFEFAWNTLSGLLRSEGNESSQIKQHAAISFPTRVDLRW